MVQALFARRQGGPEGPIGGPLGRAAGRPPVRNNRELLGENNQAARIKHRVLRLTLTYIFVGC